MRLRSDILWAAKRWKAAAEQIELLYGHRWREFSPLDDAERSDILRGAIGYALGDEAIGLARFRERYAAKMAGTPDAHAFDVVSAPIGATGAEFGDVAKAVSSVSTLDGFLADMRKRYPDSSPVSRDADNEAAKPQAAVPQASPAEKDAANKPADAPAKPKAGAAPKARAKPDASPTGSIRR